MKWKCSNFSKIRKYFIFLFFKGMFLSPFECKWVCMCVAADPRPVWHRAVWWGRRQMYNQGSLSLSPTPRPFHQVRLYSRRSPVSAVALSNSAQLQDHFIRYGFMAEIHLFQLWVSAQIQDCFIRYGFLYCRHHLFQQWVCLAQPESKTVSSGMALWQTFSCGSLTLSNFKTVSSGMILLQTLTGFSCGSLSLPNFKTVLSGKTLLQTLTGFSCGSLSLPNFKTVLSGKTLLQTFTSVFQLWVSHSAKLKDCFVR